MKLKVNKKTLLLVRARRKAHKDIMPSRYQNGSAIIAEHPQVKLIIEWLREGSSAASIARYLAQNGLIDQAVATFTDYLLAFKRCYPELLEDNPTVSLDDLVSPNKPPVDVEQELHRMFRLQKIRLAVGVENELVGKRLSKDGYRDMSVAHDYLQTIAKFEGKLNSPHNAYDTHNYSEEVKAEFIAIRKDEESRKRMKHLTMQFLAKFAKNSPSPS